MRRLWMVLLSGVALLALGGGCWRSGEVRPGQEDCPFDCLGNSACEAAGGDPVDPGGDAGFDRYLCAAQDICCRVPDGGSDVDTDADTDTGSGGDTDSDTDGDTDADTDTGSDTGTNTLDDAGVDAGDDAGVDAGVDGGTDTETDTAYKTFLWPCIICNNAPFNAPIVKLPY
ncbi:MAG: hypothetical protein PHU25_04260 [Deltaproteobacteria bacterium]|nr:hypothetical protein [Deltaproteobacteria bacterium]